MKETLTLQERTTFEDAVDRLDKGGIGFLAILDDKCRLLGILTDGDIRRAILNQKFSLLEAMNTSPRTVDYRYSKRRVIQLLKDAHLKHMPLVDEKNVYKGLVFLDDLEFNSKPNRVVIMAGGFGRRLGELTRETPKPMLRVGKKNMLENLIDNFSDHGFHRFYISVHYKAEVIKNYFGDGSKFGVEIEYLEEESPLGTAGCLSLLPEQFSEPILVINGDILTNINFEELLVFHNENHAYGTMCVRKYETEIPYGVVTTSNERIVSIEEKPTYRFYVNAGIYVLNPIVIKFIPKNEYFDMTSLFDNIINKNKKALSYELVDYWADIGLPKDFEKAANDIIEIEENYNIL